MLFMRLFRGGVEGEQGKTSKTWHRASFPNSVCVQVFINHENLFSSYEKPPRGTSYMEKVYVWFMDNHKRPPPSSPENISKYFDSCFLVFKFPCSLPLLTHKTRSEKSHNTTHKSYQSKKFFEEKAHVRGGRENWKMKTPFAGEKNFFLDKFFVQIFLVIFFSPTRKIWVSSRIKNAVTKAVTRHETHKTSCLPNQRKIIKIYQITFLSFFIFHLLQNWKIQ